MSTNVVLTVCQAPSIVALTARISTNAIRARRVPDFAFTVGYTNASWTLKADLVSPYVCRLLAHMDERGYRQCVPERDPSVAEEPFLDFTAGYVLRSIDAFPKQGARAPWRLRMNYLYDIRSLRRGSVEEEMRCSASPRASSRV
ncbi:hypothetical protein [Streptomyces sp. NBC_01803]|uniref:hypothetical protein n=1 Tax=Streptomyces sp. NBC_01803 TaxID=2975946 RepID=UPI002DD93C04|nr:hypothetical protein [Streptomyces sp. NBC_01803]